MWINKGVLRESWCQPDRGVTGARARYSGAAVPAAARRSWQGGRSRAVRLRPRGAQRRRLSRLPRQHPARGKTAVCAARARRKTENGRAYSQQLMAKTAARAK